MSKKDKRTSPAAAPGVSQHSKRIHKDKAKASGAKVRLPCIVSDIDGVVIKGTGSSPTVIGGAKKEVERVLTYSKGGCNIPFVFLTNGGSVTEQAKVDGLNKYFEYSERETKLTKEHILLCHTVFRSKKV